MNITFLGTSAGLPTKERNTQTIILSLAPTQNSFWLFDAGEACQHQILHTNIKLGKIDQIFITHLHGDHIFGLPGLLTSRSFQGGEGKPLTVYGPTGIKAYIETTLLISGSHLNYPLEIIEIHDGEELIIEQIKVTVRKLHHGIDSFGYRIQFPDTQGNLISDKLIAAGIMPGPIYQQFKLQEHVEIDGVTYESKDYRMPDKPGKVIAIFGDTMPCPSEVTLAEQADVIVHESTYLEGDLDLSHKYYHSHIDDVAQLANICGVKRVLINHVSNRYDLNDIAQLTEVIKAKYPELNFVIVNDFDSFEI
ncbi:ribonuclease Z [Macrococcus capreoli]|uniref:ribonuclease Z n=1 Tax=Macrococcus capreoli TaxID=2982690 RepID=UPI0021D60D75|nr:ribonuclease Z [Macrococcus sp. TMW 2.2395]MCU7556795.1 ribonuclease Z [Macrococcus sp. TMW 2.2395]